MTQMMIKSPSGVDPILFLDRFTGTDGDDLITGHTPDIGTGWTKLSGPENPEIKSNRCTLNSGAPAFITCDATLADCTITADTYTPTNGGTDAGLCFRFSSSNCWFLHCAAGAFTLYKYTGGYAQVATDSSLGTNQNIIRSIKVVLSGSSIKCYVDDNLLFDITDSWQSTSDIHGMRLYVTDTTKSIWIDDFLIEE